MSKIYDALQHLEAQRKAMESGQAPDLGANPLDLQERPTPASAPRPGSTAQSLLEHAGAVMRFESELHRRMGEAGFNGLHGLFALAEQLERALATVSRHELDGAESDLERVADRIRGMQHDLRQLKAVKTDFEGLR
ncbi:MAG: hypothetical protein IT293_14995 [Deltaproteobacteria bacterium]|nr:hypothetical protein [Deltaproteobacteria bacterium]